MVDIGKILKRSWQILWSYRTLWIFGLLLALTSGGSSSGNSGSSSRASQNNPGGVPRGLPENAPAWMRELGNWFTQNVEPLFVHPEQHIATFVMIFLVILLVVLIFSALAALVRYPSETAVIRMVDEFERSGSKVGFRQGWKLGWNRRAFRLWLIDLLLSLPVLVFLLLLAVAGLIAYASLSPTFQVVSYLGVIAAIFLGLLNILFLVVLAFFMSLLRNFFHRAAVLEGLGVWDSLRHGWAMFKRNWKSAGAIWLVMAGVGIAFGIAGIIIFFLLIPAYLVMLVPALIVAVLPALAGFAITSIFTSSPLAWIVAALIALPFFFSVLFSPLLFVSGWYRIFGSNVWTLTYREIQALESLSAPLAPQAQEQTPPAA